MKMSLVHFLDIAFCAVVLRLILGWLFAYRRLVRLLIALAGLLLVVALVYRMALPLAGVLTVVLILPIAVIAFLSFLPELGRIYHSASRGHMFSFRRAYNLEMLPLLKATLIELARKRKGALIVLERGDAVDTLITGGESVDALFNKALVLSIFDTNCPRHDGAIVLKNDRILRMGGVLPLATADGADESFGTRHLAAIGLTELCDADVLVVSEERGVISHSRQGHIATVDPERPEEVEEMLRLVMGDDKGSDHARRPGTLSLVLWGVALVLAAVGSFSLQPLWDRFTLQESDDTFTQGRVVLEGIPENFYIESLDQPTSQVYIRKPKNVVLPPSINLVVDLAEKGPGKTTVYLPLNSKDLPKGADITKIEPDQITLVLAEAKRMSIPVEAPKFTGLSRDLKVVKVTYAPMEVEAEVRDSKWRKTNTLKISPIHLSEITKPGEYKFNIKMELPSSVRPLNGPRDLEIQVTLELGAR